MNSPLPYFFFLKCLSVLFCIPFLWLSLSFLHYFIFPPWSHLPYNLHAATCPALPRACPQPAIQQTRAGPAHTPVETGKETHSDYSAFPHPTPDITVVFLSQSFSSTLSKSVILNNFQWIKSTSPFDDEWFNVSKIFNQIFPASLC